MTWLKKSIYMTNIKKKKSLEQRLKASGLSRVRVVGRGTIIVEPGDVINSESYKRIVKKAANIQIFNQKH